MSRLFSPKHLHTPNISYWTIGQDAYIGRNVRLGNFVVIEAGDEKIGHVSISDGCLIGNFTTIRPSAVLGERTVFSHYSIIEGNVTIANDVRIGQRAIFPYGVVVEELVFIAGNFHVSNDKRMKWKRPQIDYNWEPVLIKRAARIGVRVTVLPGVTIGENSLVGAGSLVTKDVPDKAIVMGHPARVVGEVPEEEWL